MTINWYTKKEYADCIQREITFDLDNDCLSPDDKCTFVFQSADDCIKAIKHLFPNATFNLSFDLAYTTGYVEDFDDHLWELKEYRK